MTSTTRVRPRPSQEEGPPGAGLPSGQVTTVASQRASTTRQGGRMGATRPGTRPPHGPSDTIDEGESIVSRTIFATALAASIAMVFTAVGFGIRRPTASRRPAASAVSRSSVASRATRPASTSSGATRRTGSRTTSPPSTSAASSAPWPRPPHRCGATNRQRERRRPRGRPSRSPSASSTRQT